MKKNVILLLVAITSIATSCIENSNDSKKEPLLKLSKVQNINSIKTKLSEVFKSHSIVKLETNEESLIGGRSNKVLKYQSEYYISSLNTILKFDSKGNFSGKLDRLGQGPEEYHAIYDFDIVNNDIWVSTKGGIIKYDKETFSYNGKIKIGGFVNQFKYVNDSTIIVRCPEDLIFKICDSNGNIRKQFIEKDPANSAAENHQFFNVGNNIVYHVDDTQCGIVYNIALDSMYYQHILTPLDEDLTVERNKDYYKKYGYEKQYIKIAENYTRTSTIRNVDDNYVLTKFCPNGDKEFVIVEDNSYTKSFLYEGKNVTIENDLIGTKDLSFLSTIICCKAEDAIMFLIFPDMLTDENVDLDENPAILEVKL